MASLLPVPKARFFNAVGLPLSGGKVYTYEAGTTTPKTSYTDASEATPNANPVILDSRGEANIWIEGNYKIVLKNALDVEQWSVDNVQDPITAITSLFADDGGAALIGYQLEGASEVTTVYQKLAERVSVKDFGAVGDYDTDDTAAIAAADAFCAANGKALYFPSGQYGITDGISKTARHWIGDAAPHLEPFPIGGDDKAYLRPGYKDLMPGTSIFLKGTGSQTVTTTRSDAFASGTYGIKNMVSAGSIQGIAIILDCDIYDAGGTLTPFGSDNSANYDFGYFLYNRTLNYHRDFRVFGYFPKCGITIYTTVEANTGDPDYNTFHGGSTMGQIGFALVGYESSLSNVTGLSGTQTYGFNIYSKDYHTRSAASFAGADDWRCIYIDGATGVSTVISGHYFIGGVFRTYAIHPIELDACDNVYFSMNVEELPDLPNAGLTDDKKFIASASTRDVTFDNPRFTTDPIFIAEFAGTLTGQVTTKGDPYAGLVFARQNGGTIYFNKISVDASTKDPAIQFGSGSPSSSTAGWVYRRDIDASDKIEWRWNNVSQLSLGTSGELAVKRLVIEAGSSLTIASGVITVTNSYHRVDTEGLAASDDLVTINGGTEGMLLMLQSANASRTVNVVDGSGNIRIPATFAMDNSQDTIWLRYDGVNWVGATPGCNNS